MLGSWLTGLAHKAVEGAFSACHQLWWEVFKDQPHAVQDTLLQVDLLGLSLIDPGALKD